MQKGQITIGTITAIGGTLIVLFGAIFSFGGEIATIKADTKGNSEMANKANDKADQALLRVSNMEGKVDAIYNGMVERGIAKKIATTTAK